MQTVVDDHRIEADAVQQAESSGDAACHKDVSSLLGQSLSDVLRCEGQPFDNEYFFCL